MTRHRDAADTLKSYDETFNSTFLTAKLKYPLSPEITPDEALQTVVHHAGRDKAFLHSSSSSITSTASNSMSPHVQDVSPRRPLTRETTATTTTATATTLPVKKRETIEMWEKSVLETIQETDRTLADTEARLTASNSVTWHRGTSSSGSGKVGNTVSTQASSANAGGLTINACTELGPSSVNLVLTLPSTTRNYRDLVSFLNTAFTVEAQAISAGPFYGIDEVYLWDEGASELTPVTDLGMLSPSCQLVCSGLPAPAEPTTHMSEPDTGSNHHGNVRMLSDDDTVSSYVDEADVRINSYAAIISQQRDYIHQLERLLRANGVALDSAAASCQSRLHYNKSVENEALARHPRSNAVLPHLPRTASPPPRPSPQPLPPPPLSAPHPSPQGHHSTVVCRAAVVSAALLVAAVACVPQGGLPRPLWCYVRVHNTITGAGLATPYLYKKRLLRGGKGTATLSCPRKGSRPLTPLDHIPYASITHYGLATVPITPSPALYLRTLSNFYLMIPFRPDGSSIDWVAFFSQAAPGAMRSDLDETGVDTTWTTLTPSPPPTPGVR